MGAERSTGQGAGQREPAFYPTGFERTHCSHCGYEMLGLRTQELCPECGKLWDESPPEREPGIWLGLSSFVLGILSLTCIAVPPVAILQGLLSVALAVTTLLTYRKPQNGARGYAMVGACFAGFVLLIYSVLFLRAVL